MVAEEEKKKSSLSMGMIVGLIVAGLVLAGGISYYIANKIVGEKASQTAAHEPGVFVRLGDPKDGLIVNVGGVNSGRYLKIGIVLEMRPESSKEKEKEKEAKGNSIAPEDTKILDAVVYVLRSQKIDDFDPSKQDKLKELIKAEVNKVLGTERVYQVYITNFVLQ